VPVDTSEFSNLLPSVPPRSKFRSSFIFHHYSRSVPNDTLSCDWRLRSLRINVLYARCVMRSGSSEGRSYRISMTYPCRTPKFQTVIESTFPDHVFVLLRLSMGNVYSSTPYDSCEKHRLANRDILLPGRERMRFTTILYYHRSRSLNFMGTNRQLHIR
jgi:hypothetical protein